MNRGEVKQNMEQDNIMYLQSKLNKNYIKSKFRSKLFGGLNHDDVVNYISNMELEFQKTEQKIRKDLADQCAVKVALQTELDALKAKIAEEAAQREMEISELRDENELLKNEMQGKDKALQELDETFGVQYESALAEARKLEEELQKLQSEREVLSQELQLSQEEKAELLAMTEKLHQLQNDHESMARELSLTQEEKAALQGKADTAVLDEEIQRVKSETEQELMLERAVSGKLMRDLENANLMLRDKAVEIRNLENQVQKEKIHAAELEMTLREERNKLTNMQINGLKDEVSGIYLLLDELSQELAQNKEDFKNRLEQESQRAEAAENMVGELLKLGTDLRDKLSGERNLIDTQLRKIMEKHEQIVGDASGILVNFGDYKDVSSHQ